MLFGVCGGLSEFFGVDSSLMRVIVVLLAVVSGVGFFVYFLMALFVPLEGSAKTEPGEVVKENVEEMKKTAAGLEQDIKKTFSNEKSETEEDDKLRARRRNTFGLALILIGVILLLFAAGLFPWPAWSFIWPIVLIGIGIVILIAVTKRK
jgi:phage shock protein C